MKTLLFSAIFIFCMSITGIAQQDSKVIRNAGETMSKGDIRGAISILDKAIGKNEGSFEIYKMRSLLFGMTGNLQGEFNDLTKLIELKSTDGELYERRARTRMFLRHDSSLILDDLNNAIANGRNIEKVYTLRAVFLRQKGDNEGALSDYQTANGLNPESASAVVGLASMYKSLGNDAQAIATLETFLSKYENSFIATPTVEGKVVAKTDAIILKERDIVIGTESVLIVTDDDNGIVPTAEQLQRSTDKLENTKNTALAYSDLARLYDDRGDSAKALNAIEKAIKIDPTDSQLFGTRGAIKTSLKDYSGGFDDLTKAIKASPSFPFNYADRGVLLVLTNRDAEAQKDFDKFYEVVSHPKARERLELRIAEAKKSRELSR